MHPQQKAYETLFANAVGVLVLVPTILEKMLKN